jgi:undecaprenyl-diphosphatase
LGPLGAQNGWFANGRFRSSDVRQGEALDILQAIVYGIVQGLTAFLPISSDAHIRLVPAVTKFIPGMTPWQEPGPAFTAVIQLGPTLAVILYFRHELARAIRGFVGWITGKDKTSVDSKLAQGAFWGTIPIVVLGVLFQHAIETRLRSLDIIAVSFIVVGIVMFIADKRVHGSRTVADVEVKDGISVGLWQCLALIPGMSRSGSTISGSLFAGFNRESAARFSFILSVPSFTAAGIFEAIKFHKDLTGPIMSPLVVSLVVSFFVGLGCIYWLLHYLQKHGITPFVIYRIVLGLVLLGLVASGKLDPNEGAKPLDSPSQTATAMKVLPFHHA